MRPIYSLYTLLLFRYFILIAICIVCAPCILYANCMWRRSSKRMYAYVHIIKYSFIAHHCCCLLLFVMLLKFSAWEFSAPNMHWIHKRRCCSENEEMPRQMVNIQLTIRFDYVSANTIHIVWNLTVTALNNKPFVSVFAF